jgi:hypothetical protein
LFMCTTHAARPTTTIKVHDDVTTIETSDWAPAQVYSDQAVHSWQLREEIQEAVTTCLYRDSVQALPMSPECGLIDFRIQRRSTVVESADNTAPEELGVA